MQNLPDLKDVPHLQRTSTWCVKTTEMPHNPLPTAILERNTPLILGRADHSNISIPLIWVSREHCVVSSQDDQWVVKCLSMPNHIIINNVRVLTHGQEHVLSHKDEIRIPGPKGQYIAYRIHIPPDKRATWSKKNQSSPISSPARKIKKSDDGAPNPEPVPSTSSARAFPSPKKEPMPSTSKSRVFPSPSKEPVASSSKALGFLSPKKQPVHTSSEDLCIPSTSIGPVASSSKAFMPPFSSAPTTPLLAKAVNLDFGSHSAFISAMQTPEVKIEVKSELTCESLENEPDKLRQELLKTMERLKKLQAEKIMEEIRGDKRIKAFQEKVDRCEEDKYRPIIELMAAHMACGICKQILIQCQILSCGHTFCLMCYSNFRQNKKGAPKCPTCKAKTHFQVKHHSVHNFINSIMSLLPMKKSYEEAVQTYEAATVPIPQPQQKPPPQRRRRGAGRRSVGRNSRYSIIEIPESSSSSDDIREEAFITAEPIVDEDDDSSQLEILFERVVDEVQELPVEEIE